MSYDNYGTLYIGPQQMTANLGLNSFISSGDSTQLTFTKTTRGNELTYTDLNYNGAVDDLGKRWLIGGNTRTYTSLVRITTTRSRWCERELLHQSAISKLFVHAPRL